jgi:hypothetical protein
MKPYLLIAALLVLGVTGCDRQVSPVTMDAPQLAASLKWVGVCAVLCSTIGGVALIVATRGRRK